MHPRHRFGTRGGLLLMTLCYSYTEPTFSRQCNCSVSFPPFDGTLSSCPAFCRRTGVVSTLVHVVRATSPSIDQRESPPRITNRRGKRNPVLLLLPPRLRYLPHPMATPTVSASRPAVVTYLPVTSTPRARRLRPRPCYPGWLLRRQHCCRHCHDQVVVLQDVLLCAVQRLAPQRHAPAKACACVVGGHHHDHATLPHYRYHEQYILAFGIC